MPRKLTVFAKRSTWNHYDQNGVSAGVWAGVFEVLEPVRKHYVIVDRAAVQ